jgi:hypothetical protein
MRARAADARGQSTSEYVALAGIVVAVAVIVANTVGMSLRLALQTAAQRMLSAVTGSP